MQLSSLRWRWRARLFPLWAAGALAQGTNQLRPWTDYRTIMWVGDSAYKQPDKLPLFFQRLREMGINTGDGPRRRRPAAAAGQRSSLTTSRTWSTAGCA